ncbi:MAG: hypothetical protein JW769_04545 [Parachlamydiales bacterium]|nr:hypothetical protein [Parachlamydiales bacterium]
MDPKNNFKELIRWGSENPENKKRVIQGALKTISILNQSEKKLTEAELNKIAGGLLSSGCTPAEIGR